MKIREKFGLFVGKAKTSLGRFPVAFANVALFFILSLVSVWTEEMNDDIAKMLLLTTCAGVFSTGFAIFAEFLDKDGEKAKSIMIIVSVALEAVLFGLSLFLEDLVYVRVILGILVASAFCCMYLVSKKGKELSHMAHTLKNTAFSAFVGLVLLIGGLICYAAFVTLIYDNYMIDDKLFFTILVFCVSIVPALVLIFIPSKDAPCKNPGKGYKGVTVYAGLTLYYILTAILYMYMVRILVSAELPSGGVNPFVTTASAAYIFLVFALGCYEKDSAYVRFFMRFGGYFMIPLVIIQCVTLGIRLYYYGLTTSRMISICFIIITVLFIAGSLFKNRIGLGIPCLAASVIILIVTLTPFNVVSIPLMNQEHILTSTLEESGMLKNGSVDLDVEISTGQYEKIKGAYRYLKDYGDELPDYIAYDSEIYNDFDEKFGYRYIRDNNIITYCHYYNEEFAYEMTDISEYSHIVRVYGDQFGPCKEGDGLILEYTDDDGNVYKYDLEPFARYMYEKNGDAHSYNDTEGVYSLDENTSLYYIRMSYDYNSLSSEITGFDMSAYLLFK